MKLTGNQRYRLGFRNKMILQCEYSCSIDDNDPREFRMTTRWRDCTFEDYQQLCDLQNEQCIIEVN